VYHHLIPRRYSDLICSILGNELIMKGLMLFKICRGRWHADCEVIGLAGAIQRPT
jgi:hypothetical protein